MSSEERLSELSDDERAIHGVVSEYYEAFVSDPAVAATHYGEPALIVLADKVFSLQTRGDVEEFLAKGRSSLKALGYSHTRMIESRIKRLNETTALYGTVAVRMKTDGTELERAAFTYLLHKGNRGWKIHELVATDVDKLIS